MDITLLLFVIIAQSIICAGFSSYLAERKGEDSGTWLVLGFFFGVFALIAVGLIPARDESVRRVSPIPLNIEALRGTKLDQTKLCDWCLSEIRLAARVCPHCRAKFDEKIVAQVATKSSIPTTHVNPEFLASRIQANDLDAVRALLSSGIDLEARNPSHRTPIQEAIFHGRHEILRVLLEAGADPDGKSTLSSPLVLAVSKSDLNAAELLLSSGANPKRSIHAPFTTPLLLASGSGDIKLAQFLLNNGAKFTRTDGSWSTSPEIVEAAKKGHLLMIRLLVAKGGQVGGWKHFPMLNSAYRAAYFSGHREVAQYLSEQMV